MADSSREVTLLGSSPIASARVNAATASHATRGSLNGLETDSIWTFDILRILSGMSSLWQRAVSAESASDTSLAEQALWSGQTRASLVVWTVREGRVFRTVPPSSRLRWRNRQRRRRDRLIGADVPRVYPGSSSIGTRTCLIVRRCHV